MEDEKILRSSMISAGILFDWFPADLRLPQKPYRKNSVSLCGLFSVNSVVNMGNGLDSARIFDIFNKTVVISTGTQWNGEIYLNRFLDYVALRSK